MPTYEYACDACGKGFEVVQKMVDLPLLKCPSCGKKIRRVLSGGIGISFKGSGFYVTDKDNSRRSPQSAQSASASSPQPPSAPGPAAGIKPSAAEK